MRKLKFHENKLWKKVSVLEWKREGGHLENLVMQCYSTAQIIYYDALAKTVDKNRL